MTVSYNAFGQPVGFAVSDWNPPDVPPHAVLEGRLVRLEPLQVSQHGTALYQAIQRGHQDADWTYMPYGPFNREADYLAWLQGMEGQTDPMFYAIVDKRDAQPLGLVSYLRINPACGSIEAGHVFYTQRLKRHAMATEAMYLLLQCAFDLGYRRFEWKCDALNMPSRRAAQRLGFSFEGVFRQALIYKGRNRDTAWFAVTDADWSRLDAVLQRWLSPTNFTDDNRQKTSLSQLTAPLLMSEDPALQ